MDSTCDRWRDLYRAASSQVDRQHQISNDHARSQEDRERARRLRWEAEGQRDLLTDIRNAVESDFYSYRYFASEGFLPGYNFPRLPLSAFIPGKTRDQREFVSRPRFLAVSEFGPRAIIYHEGVRYRINRVILPVENHAESGGLVTTAIKQCGHCGYFHPVQIGDGQDNCEMCGRALPAPLSGLFRIQNVATKRADKINSDEEERSRLGYEIRSGVRLPDSESGNATQKATVRHAGGELLELTYGHASTIWKINIGWRRRGPDSAMGFVLDTERGYWARNQEEGEDDPEDPMTASRARVIPYVEDRKNALLIEPRVAFDSSAFYSLQAALKNALQTRFQLEDGELATEPLPSRDNPRLLLIYEAAEGGAGVLRRLVEDPAAVSELANTALSLCHFNPETGEDKKQAPRAREACEAACYNCLMSYMNQVDHAVLDRHSIRNFLLYLSRSNVTASPGALPRAEHLDRLFRLCGSNLERNWLETLESCSLRLPTHGQKRLDGFGTRPDFLYEQHQTVVYIDGPPHEYPDRQVRDAEQQTRLEDGGYTVIRFKHTDDWDKIFQQYPSVFGVRKADR